MLFWMACELSVSRKRRYTAHGNSRTEDPKYGAPRKRVHFIPRMRTLRIDDQETPGRKTGEEEWNLSRCAGNESPIDRRREMRSISAVNMLLHFHAALSQAGK